MGITAAAGIGRVAHACSSRAPWYLALSCFTCSSSFALQSAMVDIFHNIHKSAPIARSEFSLLSFDIVILLLSLFLVSVSVCSTC